MSERHEIFMQKAIEVAKRGLAQGEIPIGCVVVLGDTIVSQSFCEDRTKGLLFHAELGALGAIDRKKYSIADRKRMSLYSTLEPCLMCMGATMSSFIGELVYSVPAPADGSIELVKSKDWGDRSYENYTLPHITGGVLSSDVMQLFEQYLAEKSSGPYADFVRGVMAGKQN